ncbi:MAG TPA: hypothetical protein VF580_13605 [Thermoanaerobaculia bacterium]
MTARRRDERPARSLLFLSLLGAVLLGGLSLRCYRLFDLPAGPWIDEAYALRAAREATAAGWRHIPASAPLQPPGAPFVNFWVTGPYLAFASAVDRAAGGGIASFRLVSTFPAVLLFAGGVLLSWEVLRPRRDAFLLASFLLASSSWLLSTSRWGWVANFSAALVVLSAFVALRTARTESRRLAILQAAAAGVLLGVAQYGYPSAWLVAPIPFLVLAAAVPGWRTSPSWQRQVETAAAGAAGLVLVAAPLVWHYASHPDRAAVRPRELSVLSGGAAPAIKKLAANVWGYGCLFVVGGDGNERHGTPGRPVLPAAVSGLAAVGLVAASRIPRARLVSLAALLLVSGGLLASGDEPNAFRISAAAPFLVVLAVAAGISLADRLLPGFRWYGRVLLAAVLLVSGALEAASFLDWLSSPRLFGAFGGPERELADAIRGEVSSRRAAGLVLDPRAARNPWVVDVLLASPSGGGRRVLAWSLVSPELLENAATAAKSGRTILIAAPRTKDALDAVGAGGGEAIAGSTPLEGFPGWVLWRIQTFKARSSEVGPPERRTEPR